ncbi:unnamed protein product [Camellia sinensis]
MVGGLNTMRHIVVHAMVRKWVWMATKRWKALQISSIGDDSDVAICDVLLLVVFHNLLNVLFLVYVLVHL